MANKGGKHKMGPQGHWIGLQPATMQTWEWKNGG